MYVCCRRITADALQKNIMPSDDEIGGYYLSRICMERIYLKKSDMFFFVCLLFLLFLSNIIFFFRNFGLQLCVYTLRTHPFRFLHMLQSCYCCCSYYFWVFFVSSLLPSIDRPTERSRSQLRVCIYKYTSIIYLY